MRTRLLSVAVLLALAGLAGGHKADSTPTPTPTPTADHSGLHRSADARGEAWDDHTYRGTTADVVIPHELRQRNSTGSLGRFGICVIASATTNGRYQDLGPEMARLWAEAKRHPGGHAPAKLKRQIKAAGLDHLKWASYVGRDPALLERYTEAGYPVAATMNTGRLYGYRRIAHMVSLVHFDQDTNTAAVIDNNRPEVTAWMPADEYVRRWRGRGSGWAWVWDHLPPVHVTASPGPLLALGAALGLGLWFTYVRIVR